MRATKVAPRDRLLKAANDLFYKEGIRSVGINRVLEESQTPIMTLYRHFGSKDGLAAEYLKRRSEHFLEKFDSGVKERASSPRERILATFDMLRELVEEPDYRGCAFINATVEMASPDHELTKIARHHKDAARQWFAEFAAEAGVFVAADLYRESSSSAHARSAAETLIDAALAAGPTGSAAS
jgi:AcrR family transcriptional regulator